MELTLDQQDKVDELVQRHMQARQDGWYYSTYHLCRFHPELRQAVKKAIRKLTHNRTQERWISDVLADDR